MYLSVSSEEAEDAGFDEATGATDEAGDIVEGHDEQTMAMAQNAGMARIQGIQKISHMGSIIDREFKHLNNVTTKLVGHLKIFTGWIQIICSLPLIFNIPWPDSFSRFMQLPAINIVFNLNVLGVFGSFSPCAFTMPFTSQFILHMLFLPYVIGVSVVSGWVAATLQAHVPTCQRRFHSFSVWIRVKKVITIVVFLVYPSLTVRIFSMFKCVELDQSEFYLQAELSMRCHEGPWLFYSAVAFASIGVYIVGIPVLSFVMLYRHRHVH